MPSSFSLEHLLLTALTAYLVGVTVGALIGARA